MNLPADKARRGRLAGRGQRRGRGGRRLDRREARRRGPVPAPSGLEGLRRNPDYAGWTIGVIEVDPALLDDAAERVNIALPRRVLRHLDAPALAAGRNPSGSIARLALAVRRKAAEEGGTEREVPPARR